MNQNPDLVFSVTVTNPDGWHIRPIAAFTDLVFESGASVWVGRLGEESVRGDSVISLLTMAVKTGEHLEIRIAGAGREGLADSLKALFDA